MHPRERVAEALALVRSGLTASEVARRTGIPRSTVRDWICSPGSARRLAGGCEQCGGPEHRFAELGSEYAYLLGLYLGDGSIATHPRGVFKLRVMLDAKYPGIIDACAHAMEEVVPRSKALRWLRPYNDVEVYSYSKTWPCLFPQHGPGMKHCRPIALVPWQLDNIARYPDLLLRGLIHSDGCRFVNTGRKNWRAWRYSFSNRSEDIRGIFCGACDRLGLRTTAAPYTVYVSRKADVAVLDAAGCAKS